MTQKKNDNKLLEDDPYFIPSVPMYRVLGEDLDDTIGDLFFDQYPNTHQRSPPTESEVKMTQKKTGRRSRSLIKPGRPSLADKVPMPKRASVATNPPVVVKTPPIVNKVPERVSASVVKEVPPAARPKSVTVESKVLPAPVVPKPSRLSNAVKEAVKSRSLIRPGRPSLADKDQKPKVAASKSPPPVACKSPTVNKVPVPKRVSVANKVAPPAPPVVPRVTRSASRASSTESQVVKKENVESKPKVKPSPTANKASKLVSSVAKEAPLPSAARPKRSIVESKVPQPVVPKPSRLSNAVKMPPSAQNYMTPTVSSSRRSMDTKARLPRWKN